MHWRQLVMDLGPLPAEAVEAAFDRHGAEAVSFSDAGDEPLLEPGPGETPLWRQTRITGLFAADRDVAPLLAELARDFGLDGPPPHRVELLADRAWEREWLKDFQPMRFGRRLWVCPAGQSPGAPDAVVVDLDPGLAFGTGSHPTTALCLDWLDGLPLAGRNVLDFGCGSGILGIAALKLGAARVTGVDNDPQALVASRANAERNGVAGRFAATGEPPAGRYDVVVANILAGPLVERAAWLCARLAPAAPLALSGILADQADTVRAAYERDVDFDDCARDGDWVRLAGRKR